MYRTQCVPCPHDEAAVNVAAEAVGAEPVFGRKALIALDQRLFGRVMGDEGRGKDGDGNDNRDDGRPDLGHGGQGVKECDDRRQPATARAGHWFEDVGRDVGGTHS